MIRKIKTKFITKIIIIVFTLMISLLFGCEENMVKEDNFEISNDITHIQYHDNTYMSVDFNEEEREKLLSLLNDLTYYKSEKESGEVVDGYSSYLILTDNDGERIKLSNQEADVLEMDGYLYYFKEPHGVGEVVMDVLKRLQLPNLDEVDIITVSINDIDIPNSPYPPSIELDNEEREEVLERLEAFSKDYEVVEDSMYDGYGWAYSLYLSSEQEAFDLMIIDDNTIDILGVVFYSEEPHNLVEFLDPIYNKKE